MKTKNLYQLTVRHTVFLQICKSADYVYIRICNSDKSYIRNNYRITAPYNKFTRINNPCERSLLIY